MAHEVRIINGPSLLELMFSLVVGSNTAGDRRCVTFSLGQGDHPFIKLAITIRIEGLTREDGSGENWLFEGYQEEPADNDIVFLNKVTGYFSTRHRTGYIKWED